jgi:hypothetical protein
MPVWIWRSCLSAVLLELLQLQSCLNSSELQLQCLFIIVLLGISAFVQPVT